MESDASVFESRESAMEALAARLGVQSADEAIALQVAERLVDDFESRAPVPGFRLRIARWVIKNQDFSLFATLAPAAIAAATAAADPKSQPAVAAAIATTSAALLALARRLVSYSIMLSSEQYEVLFALKTIGRPATTEEISAMVRRRAKESSLAVRMILNALGELRVRSGEARALVEQDAQRRWHILDI